MHHDVTPTPPLAADTDWTEVYARHARRLRRLIARRVEASAIEDVLQETFARAYRSRHTLDTGRPIGPWLTTIAIRAVLDCRRATDVPLSEADHCVAPDASEEVCAAESRKAIAAAFAMLTARQRRLLRALTVDGSSQAALARREGLAPEAVRAAVLRARRRFRADYEQLTGGQGLVGVGSLKSALGRLRNRMSRLEALVPNHAEAMLGIAALVTVLAVSPATPSALSGTLPAQASIAHGRETVDDISVGSDPDEAGKSPRYEISARFALSGADVAGSANGASVDLHTGPQTFRYDALGTEMTVGSDGTGGSKLYLEVTGPAGHDGRTFVGVETENCNDKLSFTLMCTAFDAVADNAEST